MVSEPTLEVFRLLFQGMVEECQHEALLDLCIFQRIQLSSFSKDPGDRQVHVQHGEILVLASLDLVDTG